MRDLRESPVTGGLSRPAGPAGRPIPRAVWAACGVVALGAFLGNMDGSIVAVGLESMRASLGVGLAEIQWVATSYLLGLSAALPLAPWLTRRLGAGRLWLWALAAFVVTSALCALAPTAVLLIVVRSVQGMSAGVLVAAGQTVIGLAVGPDRLGRMMGVLGLVVGLAPIVGPSIGGLVLAHFSWPALFWLNVPVGMLAVVLGLRVVPRGEPRVQPRMDWLGLSLVSLGLPLAVCAFTALGIPGSTAGPLYLALAAAGLVAVAVFAWWSLRGPHPVLRLRLVAHPVMAPGLTSVLLSGANMTGAVLLLPLWFQLRLGVGTATTGLLLVSLGLGTTVVVAFAGRLADAYGGGVVSLAGSLVVLASTAPWPWLGPDTPMALVQVLFFVRGAGLGLSMMPAMAAAYASVRADDLGDATALANIVMRVGGALGGALCVIVLSRGLAAGAESGFRGAFALLTVLCVLAAAASAWLRRAEGARRGATVNDSPKGKR